MKTALPVMIPVTILSLVAGAGAVACPPMPDRPYDDGTYVVQMERTWAALSSRTTDVIVGPTTKSADANPAVDGAWLEPRAWPVIAIHSAVLPSGLVLQYSYPNGGEGSRARLWHPGTGGFANVDWSEDVFCSGLVHLPDGTLYVIGGNDQGCEARGLRSTASFDPATRHWTALETMVRGRWYPSGLTMADGNVLLFSGRTEFCESNADIELYTPGKGLEEVAGGHRYLQLFPRLHLLTSGKVAHVGPENEMWTFSFADGWEYVTREGFNRFEGTSVLVPGRTDQVMVVGGRSPLTASCKIIDFSEPEPFPRSTGQLNHARAHAEAVILPDQTVLLMGGGTTELYQNPVNIPEIYDPDTETWREVAPHVYGRMYHSTSVLLPDGRVLVAGQDNGASAFIGEIYMPPYLFRGARPTIASAPAQVYYGRSFDIQTPEADEITSAVMIRLSSVTHSVNFDQRLVDLAFMNQGGGVIRATAPPGPTHAPPGYYMLFILNGDEVPSPSTMVHVQPWTRGDVDNDGDVDFADVILLLGAWGACPPPPVECAADVNGDGVVDVADILEVIANWS